MSSFVRLWVARVKWLVHETHSTLDAKETMMQYCYETTCVDGDTTTEDKPSMSFINAISEFLDTDPNDLLLELGYYEREPIEATR
jgi:hypothetical protein